MMNYILPIMVVFSFFCAIATGNMRELSSAVISSGNDGINLAIKLIGIICLWNGLINIASKSGLTNKICTLINPLLRLIFPNIKDKKAQEHIAMNITANLLGLDNAATPLGLKAMKRLQEINKTSLVADNDMVKFVVINTASIHLVPTTVALLRREHGSTAPSEILLPALITSITALSIGLLLTTILKRVFK